MRYSKKIILFLTCFATVFSFLIISVSAEWNATVGYYGSVTMEQLEEKLLFENENNIAHKLNMKVDYDIGAYRLYYVDSGDWYLNTEGTFPYVLVGGDAPEYPEGASTAAPPSVSRNRFINVKDLDLGHIQTVVLTQDALAESVQLINDEGFNCTMAKASINGTWFWVIMRSSGTSAAYYCNSSGYPYVALAEDSATDIDFDYIVDNSTDNSIVAEDSQIIDIENGTFNIIDDSGEKISLNIESLLYDASTNSYTVNAYNTVNEGDAYSYTYYTYNITYNITNTYITYIGSNDAYEKEEYEFYYQLPDGRSSADLTADEVAGMSFEFHDVVNYSRSATDVSVRALYHFDGDTNDSSYFSTQGSFNWTSGASITYMEAPSAFDGALYLDTTVHAFDVALPSHIGSGDFSLQFRYYQASEPDTVSNINNSVKIDSTTVLSWDEQKFYYGSTAIADIPVGTWNEIGIVRSSGRLYIYLNGLEIHNATLATAFLNTITFAFGASGSRAYSMLDELRVLNFAVATAGASYTPTKVPYDSNLVLVLPDSSRPIADEYYSFSTAIKPTYVMDYTLNGASVQSATGNPASFPSAGAYTFCYNPTYNSVSVEEDFVRVGCSTYSSPSVQYFVADTARHYITGSAVSVFRTGLTNGTYTFSIVDSELNVYSYTFTYNGTQLGEVSISFPWGSLLCYIGFSDYTTACFSVAPKAGSSIDIVYMEFVEGTEANTGHEKVTCIYPEVTMQPNTAAVQSEIPVNGYTVGGVRPTLPVRGDLWFPVQENRIQACYIYTGSMWEEVGCRWYTGSRWIPIYAFDLSTLQDLYDIADAADAIIPITSESAFWRWWQLQWLDFREYLDGKFDELIAAISGRSSVTDIACDHDWVVTDRVNGDVGEYIFVDSIDECIDTSKQYVLSDGYIYSYVISEDSCVLPEGYTELAWIESTGTQYIDAKFKPNQDTRVILDVEITGENESLAANDIFGCRTSASSKTYAVQWNTANNYFQHFYNNGYNNLDFGDFTRQTIEMNKNVLSFNGVTHERTYAAFQCDYTMYLFALNNAGVADYFSAMRVFACQIYDNGTFVRVYIPCINPYEEIGLYDIVNSVFYGNAGTGSFIAGSEVSSVEGRWESTGILYKSDSSGKSYDILTCTICGAQAKDHGDGPELEKSTVSFGGFLELLASSMLEIATTVLTEFIGLIADLIKMFIQAVMDFIGGFVGVLSDAAGHIVTLGDSVAPIGDFVRGVYGAIPDDIEAVLTGSFVVIVAVSVISFLL